jgi:hypothetical protein
MRVRTNLVIVSALLAVLLLPGLAGAGGGGKQRTSFTSQGPAPTIGTPFCDAEQHCLFPGTRTATYEGDWVGTGIALGAAASVVDEDVRFAGPVLWLFSGTIEDCGTGTLVYANLETGDAVEMSGEGTWQIFEGFGTGDLADVSGKGTGSGSVAEGSRYKGTIRCG